MQSIFCQTFCANCFCCSNNIKEMGPSRCIRHLAGSSRCRERVVRKRYFIRHEILRFKLICLCLLYAGVWKKEIITNRDVIRLHVACVAMDIDARQSIFYTAVNAFGEKGVNTNM